MDFCLYRGTSMTDDLRMADAYGVPEYFATHCKLEDAGGGCVRIYNCTERNGLLIPHYTVVMPAQYLVGSSKRVSEIARKIFGEGATAH